MITSCSHTFCSLCIRRYLSQEGKCPACREQDQEIKLRRNWVVEELVTNFKDLRRGVLEFAQNAANHAANTETESERPKKRRKIAMEPQANGMEKRSTRSQSKRITSQTSQLSAMSTQEEIAASEDEGSVYQDEPAPELNDGLVGCPSCSRRMKEALINNHLDRCLAGTATPPASSPQPPQIKAGTIAYTQTKPSSSSRLPTINYSLLNESKMRAKLKELGIPNHGSKELMRKRHTEWVNLWNANCDSLNQVSKRELLRSLDTWERTLGRQVDRNKEASGVMVKDFDRVGYMLNQKGNFDDLIAQARAKRKSAQKEAAKEMTPEAEMQVNGDAESLPLRSQEPNGEEAEPIVIEESPIKRPAPPPTLHERILPLGVQLSQEDLEMRAMTASLLPPGMRHLRP